MREFKVAVATDSKTGETGPPCGSCRRSSSSSSWTGFSATGFLLRFLTLPISRAIRCSCRTESFSRAKKQGAGRSNYSKGTVQRPHFNTKAEQCVTEGVMTLVG